MDKTAKYFKSLYIRLKYYRYGWRGNYSSWKEALAASTGYNAANILDKVRAATLKVRRGEAVYERDSMLFDRIEYSWPLLTHLLWIAGMNGNYLSVIDFGGSLGTTWFQTRRYLRNLKRLNWSVVEQPAFVTTGKKDIANEQLDFFTSAAEAVAARGAHDVLLLSCVLPYVEKPLDLLKELAALDIPYIIVDSTYFNEHRFNRLTVQKVPPAYYNASYPAWFLNYDEVIMTLTEKYDMVAEYCNEQFLYLKGEKIMYRGFIMHLKTH